MVIYWQQGLWWLKIRIPVLKIRLWSGLCGGQSDLSPMHPGKSNHWRGQLTCSRSRNIAEPWPDQLKKPQIIVVMTFVQCSRVWSSYSLTNQSHSFQLASPIIVFLKGTQMFCPNHCVWKLIFFFTRSPNVESDSRSQSFNTFFRPRIFFLKMMVQHFLDNS